MKAQSLTTRLLASVSILLAVFVAIATTVLDVGFRELSDREMRRRLDVQLLALISASEEINGDELKPVAQLAETRFQNPGSGLYGEILRSDGLTSWRSNSLAGTGIKFPADLRPGELRFEQIQRTDGNDEQGGGDAVLAASRKIEWQFGNGTTGSFIYSVAEDLRPYYLQLSSFRRYTLGFFIVMMALLLGALPLVLRRLLAPLQRVEKEIEAIEAGRITEVSEGYPRELLGITTNLNTLLRGERERLARYRNTLGNLAHSFKTPLAVMRNLLGNEQVRELAIARQLDEQVGRMDDIVKYQLTRAAASGGSGLGTAPVDVSMTLQALRDALLKVYIERDLQCELDVAEGALFFGDREDLTEIAGNLLDNACKWARSRVRMSVERITSETARRDGLRMIVEEDGPGIPAAERLRVLERGARLDERVSGQGIGLSIVRELVHLNRGRIIIEESSLGGARIEIVLPPA